MIKIAKIVFKLIKSEIRSSIYAKSHLALLLCIKIIIKRCRSPPAFNFKNLKLNAGREMKERIIC